MLIQATSRIKIGFNVAVTPWLHPFQWAKYMASIDAASDGRLIAGFGLGYAPTKGLVKSLHNLGIDGTKRGSMSDEALDFITRLWTSHGPISFEGRHYRGTDLAVEPKPVQKPYPELWWAGDAAPSLARSARYATYMEMSYPMLSVVRERAGQLRDEAQRHGRHCRLAVLTYCNVIPAADRNRSLADQYFEVTPNREAAESLPVGGPEHCAAVLKAYEGAGAAHIVLDMQRHGRDPITIHHEQMELFTREVIPLLSS
jgi:alkanesulfonate monooxygenase SsuD/methylene tetrahydromethanopterin reductase-like flavin-dependent oxidoreductase (luciferase family)